MRSVFISDLHLSAERPQQVELFHAFLRGLPLPSQLFILGDLFEIWLGDDDDSAPHAEILEQLSGYTTRGGQLFVMRGNRDFLLGEAFSAATGAVLLEDFHLIELGNEPVLLTHGDLLCTKDVKYQAFRQFVRDPKNQQEFLSHSLAERREIAAHTQTGTKASMLEKDDFIMDVEQQTVLSVMKDHGVKTLIHGHTHRPDDHHFNERGEPYQRLVLGDWYEQDSVIDWHSGAFRRSTAKQLLKGADLS